MPIMLGNSEENKVFALLISQIEEEKQQHSRYAKWAWKMYFDWPVSALSLRPPLEELVVRFPDTAERIKQLKEL
jgi:hypothetical protein